MIRPYQTNDKEQVLEILRLNTPKYFAFEEEQELEKYLEVLLEDYFVFEENGEVVGSGGINYFYDQQNARISWDLIHPDFQEKGIGTQLLRFRIKHIRKKQSIKQIVVRTSQLVFKFYEKAGFQLERIEKDFWAKGIDMYYMTLNSLF